MFDVSFSELVLILVVGLLVFGPEKLPGVIRSTSLWIGKLRRGFNQIRTEIEREVGLDDLKREIHNQAIMDSIKNVQDDLHKAQQELQHAPYDVADLVKQNHQAAQQAQLPAEDTAPPAPTTTSEAAPVSPPRNDSPPKP